MESVQIARIGANPTIQKKLPPVCFLDYNRPISIAAVPAPTAEYRQAYVVTPHKAAIYSR